MSIVKRLSGMGLGVAALFTSACATAPPKFEPVGPAVTDATCISSQTIAVTDRHGTQNIVVTSFNKNCRDARNFMSAYAIYHENITDESRDNLGRNFQANFAAMRAEGNTAYLAEIDRQIGVVSGGRDNLDKFEKRMEAALPVMVNANAGFVACPDNSIGQQQLFSRLNPDGETRSFFTRSNCVTPPAQTAQPQ